MVSFTVIGAAEPQRRVQVAPRQSTLQLSVQVMSQTAPPRHWTLLDAPTCTVQLESSSQCTFELSSAVTLQSLPAAQSVSQEPPQATSQVLPAPQSKLHESRQVSLEQTEPAWHMQLVPVQGQAGPGQAEGAGPLEQPARRPRTKDAESSKRWVMRSGCRNDRADARTKIR